MIIQISTHFDVRYGHDPVILIKMPYYNVTMMLLQDVILTKAALLSLSPVSYSGTPNPLSSQLLDTSCDRNIITLQTNLFSPFCCSE